MIVGTLGRPRGVLGEMYVTPDTDFPQRFVGLKEIYISNRQRWDKFAIASSRLVSGRPVIRFETVTTPEEAARLTNRKLAVLKNQVVSLPDDTYYIFDLIGCEVREDGTDRLIGSLTDIERYPANDVYVVETTSGKLLRCPAVKQFVKQVGVKRKQIRLVTAGLFEVEKT